MDIVSFETAVRLKEARFPQPEPEAGQFWYNTQGGEILVCKSFKRQELDPLLESGIIPDNELSVIAGTLIFSPTATDILRELHDYAVVFDDSQEPKGFTCFDTLRRIPTEYPQTHANPSEACAEAWLSSNK